MDAAVVTPKHYGIWGIATLFTIFLMGFRKELMKEILTLLKFSKS